MRFGLADSRPALVNREAAIPPDGVVDTRRYIVVVEAMQHSILQDQTSAADAPTPDILYHMLSFYDILLNSFCYIDELCV